MHESYSEVETKRSSEVDKKRNLGRKGNEEGNMDGDQGWGKGDVTGLGVRMELSGSISGTCWRSENREALESL